MIKGQASRGSATHGEGSMIGNHGCTERFSRACACIQDAERSKKNVYIVPCFVFSVRAFVWAKAEKRNKKRRRGIWLEFGHFSVFYFPMCSYNGNLKEGVLFCTIRVTAFLSRSASSFGFPFSLSIPTGTPDLINFFTVLLRSNSGHYNMMIRSSVRPNLQAYVLFTGNESEFAEL